MFERTDRSLYMWSASNLAKRSAFIADRLEPIGMLFLLIDLLLICYRATNVAKNPINFLHSV